MNDFSGFQCSGGYDSPAPFRLLTHETLLNITGQNETEYYLFTTDLYRLKRYGGLSFDNERPPRRNQTNETTTTTTTKTTTTTTTTTSTTNSGQDQLEFSQQPTELSKYQLIQNLIKNRIARIWYNNKGKKI